MNKPYALITGASSGIGLEMARQLAASQHHLILVARSEATLCDIASELHAQHGVNVEVYAMDLSKPGSARGLIHAIGEGGLERIDLLVNNAGFGIHERFNHISLEQTQAMMQLNMNTLCELTYALVPVMTRMGRGRIINLASVAAFQPCPNFAVYAATKAFVLSLSEALNLELQGTGVTVTAVCPGATNTRFHDVAGSSNALAMKLMDSADKVARLSLKAASAGKSVVITGLTNKPIPWASRLLPRSVVGRTAGFLFRR
ncbi:SDR family oxidoreductase [Limnobacter humi]|uniref:SDR family oxidoreductase n=1 Tax=Limnobacter humi TaxID=1778671 RepID=A0ABT1WJ73_9BURK|nr:SDR family oxidoreductase [Limnobacter humi]MCQ8897566.1 SDR family oxidoreductase [Limnobacter humi]